VLSIAITPTFLTVLLAMFVAGAAEAVWMIGREIAGVDLVKPDQRGRLMSGFMGFNSTGMALGPALGGIIVVVAGYQMVYYVYAAIAFGVLLVSWLAKSGAQSGPRARPTSTAPTRPWTERLSFRALVRLVQEIEPGLRRSYLVFVFATTVMMGYRMILQAMLPLYAGSYLGFSPSEVGFLFSISGVFVFAMILPAGFITDKVGRKWATVPSTAMPAMAFILFPFFDTFLQLALISALLGIANGLSLGSLAVSTYDVIPTASRGRLQALRRTTSEIGGVSAPLFSGIIANATNPGVPFLVFAPFLVVAAVLLAIGAKETLVKAPSKPPA
jgi:MFS family permease